MPPRLITITFSHYCEKARWALERCGVAYDEDGHLPLLHYRATRRAGAGRTVPVLVDGAEILTDSTDIVAWADARRRGMLLPTDGSRDEALALEDDFDRQLGPAARRWAYFHLLPRRELLPKMLGPVPLWQARAFRVLRPLAAALLRRGLRIDEAGVERSRVKIEETFARVAALLADGRRYLAGGRFTVADLTFASLAAPILLPAEYPVPLPMPEELGEAPRAQILAWRRAPAGEFALRLYREDRRL
jgi:glutathione S-transferase